MTKKNARKQWFSATTGFFALITVLSFFTHFYNYQQPAALFWDENYHLTSAQKYMNGVYFMQAHPPLGKMMIALGELIIDANPGSDNQFINEDYTSTLPSNFSFAGYRFFPALFSWMIAPLFFGIFLLLTKKPMYAALFSFLYIFDNALIVHNRGAMLEPILLFFIMCSLYGYFLLIDKINRKQSTRSILLSAACVGTAVGLAISTKLVGLIMIALIPALLFFYFGQWKRIAVLGGMIGGFAIGTVLIIWYAHIAIGNTRNPSLKDNGYYRASDTYKHAIDDGATASPILFPTALNDQVRYMFHDHSGVPKLNLCKEDENGSPWFYWPFGARSINYRWSTPDGNAYQYLYLQANPAIWWLSTASVIAAMCIVFSAVFFGTWKSHAYLPYILTLLLLYGGYMGAISLISRVMYLYHYFPPLLFSMGLVPLVWMELTHIGPKKITEQHKFIGLAVVSVIIVLTYLFYSPFTYYRLITDEQFSKRAIFPLWDLRCVKCEKRNTMYFPEN